MTLGRCRNPKRPVSLVWMGRTLLCHPPVRIMVRWDTFAHHADSDSVCLPTRSKYPCRTTKNALAYFAHSPSKLSEPSNPPPILHVCAAHGPDRAERLYDKID
jgi:hypothetical protein